MKFKPFNLLFILVCILFVGCELYYLPPQTQTPAHKSKGDIALNVQGLYTGSASASYAFSNHGFIGTSFMGYSANNSDTFSNDFFRVLTVEGGYYAFDPEGELQNLHLQVSGGIGAGTVGDPSNAFEVDFSRFYIQPSIGFISSNKYLENHLALRITHMAYQSQPFHYVNAFNVQFVEPTYSFRGGSEYVKLHLQLGLSIPLLNNTNSVPTEFAYDPFIFGVGIQANFNVFSKKQ